MAVSNSRAQIVLGAKVELTPSGACGEITTIGDVLAWTRSSFEANHLGMPTLDEVKTNGQKVQGGVAMLEPATLTVHFDSASGMPRPNEAETIRFTFPKRKTEAQSAYFQATGWISKVSGLSIQPDAKMTQQITIDWTGDYTYVKPVLL